MFTFKLYNLSLSLYKRSNVIANSARIRRDSPEDNTFDFTHILPPTVRGQDLMFTLKTLFQPSAPIVDADGDTIHTTYNYNRGVNMSDYTRLVPDIVTILEIEHPPVVRVTTLADLADAHKFTSVWLHVDLSIAVLPTNITLPPSVAYLVLDGSECSTFINPNADVV